MNISSIDIVLATADKIVPDAKVDDVIPSIEQEIMPRFSEMISTPIRNVTIAPEELSKPDLVEEFTSNRYIGCYVKTEFGEPIPFTFLLAKQYQELMGDIIDSLGLQSVLCIYPTIGGEVQTPDFKYFNEWGFLIYEDQSKIPRISNRIEVRIPGMPNERANEELVKLGGKLCLPKLNPEGEWFTNTPRGTNIGCGYGELYFPQLILTKYFEGGFSSQHEPNAVELFGCVKEISKAHALFDRFLQSDNGTELRKRILNDGIDYQDDLERCSPSIFGALTPRMHIYFISPSDSGALDFISGYKMLKKADKNPIH